LFVGFVSSSRFLLGALCVLAVAGCSYSMSTTSGQPGTLTVRTPGTLPPPPLSPPPLPSDGVSAPELPVSGEYVGTGVVRAYRGLGCTSPIRVTGFMVDGDRVRFLRFRGRIQPDLSVNLQAADNYIRGHFQNGQFVGMYYRPPPSCSYNFVLSPKG
jgi:hypothetical protein